MNAAALLSLCTAVLPPPPPAAGVAGWHETVVQPFALPGGVADPAGRTGYLADARGGVSAVDLRSGRVLWHSASARRPIVVTGERLYASAPAGPGRLRVVGLDVARKGEVVFESEPVTVPPAPAGRAQTLRWTPAVDHLSLTREISGDSAPSGGATVDLRTGRVGPPPEAPAGRKAPVDPGRRAVRWQGFVSGSYKALVLEESAAGKRLVLLGWDGVTGQPEPPRVLLEGDRPVVRVAANDRYLCLRDAVPSPEQKADERGRHAWSVVDAASGELVARLPYDPGTLGIALLGPRAYYLVAMPVRGKVGKPFLSPRVFRAVDPQTGKTLWERPAEGKWVTPAGA